MIFWPMIIYRKLTKNFQNLVEVNLVLYMECENFTKEQLISTMYIHSVKFYQQLVPAHIILQQFLYRF